MDRLLAGVSVILTASGTAIASDMQYGPFARIGGSVCVYGSKGRELEFEGGANANGAFDVDLAAVFLHDAVAYGEAQAGPFVLAFTRRRCDAGAPG